MDTAFKLATAIMDMVEDMPEDVWAELPSELQQKLEGEIYDLAEQVKKEVRQARNAS